MASDQKQSDDDMRQEAKKSAMTKGEATESDAALPPEAQGLIGHQLRQEYRRILSEPLPDKFAKLLQDLAQSESKPESKK